MVTLRVKLKTRALKSKPTPKKYALVGTSSVGKTTLLSELKKALKKKFPTKKITIVPEAARIYLQKRKAKKPFSYFHQSRIQVLAKLQEEKAHRKNPDFILCDRSVIDAIVYLKALGDMMGSKKLLEKVKDWLPTYNYFFLLNPKDIAYQTDDTRTEMWITRQRFHKAFVKFLNEEKIPHELLSGSQEKKIRRIMKVFSK